MGTIASTFAAGQKLTAANLNSIVGMQAIKTAGQSVTNSTVLVNDNELFLDFTSAQVGRSYLVTATVSYTSASATPGIRIAYARTGTLTNMATRYVLGAQTATANLSNTAVRTNQGFALATNVGYGTDAGLNNGGLVETFIIRVDVAGRLTLQWAQNVANASATTVNSSSSLVAYCIG